MQHFRNLLVGVDVAGDERLATDSLSPSTAEAVRRGVWLGKELGATVTFMTSLDISPHAEELLREGFGDASKSVAAAAKQVLDHLADEAAKEGVTAQSIVAFGSPWEQLTKQVLRGSHDLLLVGTRNRGAAARFLFGSTAIKLLRYCPCLVWVTRPDPKFDDINMLVACDLGPTTDHLLHTAVGGGRLLDAKVVLVHAVEFGGRIESSHLGLSKESVAIYRRKVVEEAEQKLRQHLAHTDFRTLRHGVQVHVAEGDPDVVITQAIEKYGIDLLVMGTQARTGILGAVLGNTAERLLAQVQCSLFVVKPPGFECPVKVD